MKLEMLFDNPEGKIFIIEGLPGIGKSTLLNNKYKSLNSLYHCECYREETTQPLDLFRQAVLLKSVLNSKIESFLQRHPYCKSSFESWLNRNSYSIGDYVFVAYTQIDCNNEPVKEFAATLKRYDLGDGRSSLEQYTYYHKMVWKNFIEKIYDPQKVYLSEGALFHNQLFDLIGFYKLSDLQLCEYYNELLAEIKDVDIRIIFIGANDTELLLHQTFQIRPNWYSQLENWLMYAPWAKEEKLQGEIGMISLYNRIQNAHLMLQKELGLDVKHLSRC